MIQARKSLDTSAILTARAPAKLIISGEHSVLYGQPALAMAVNRYTTTTTRWHDSSQIHFKLLDLNYARAHTLKALRRLRIQLRQEYKAFLEGKNSIRNVLKRPFELLQYSVSNLIEYLNLQLPKGMEISVGSSIPMGCGMGSSAAAVISTMCALTHFLKINWQPEDYLSFSREIENLQHGKSSGLDLHLVTYGGCVRFQNGQSAAREVPDFPLYIVNTGQPASSTGECVTQVEPLFMQSKNLATDFAAVTDSIDRAFVAGNLNEFQTGIRANHQLLQHIGVVPNKVSSFIQDVERFGGAAKICGAGAVSGDNAGIVLLAADLDVAEVANKHGYSVQTIQVDRYGARII